ncbi:MAG: hypothetical protein AAFU85_08100 [Planctomycetota bacterium]
MDSPTDSQNPYAATTELSDVAPESLDTEVNRLVKHADRVGLSIIGLAFLGLLGPTVYTLVFIHQVRECDRLIESCRRTDSHHVPRLRDARPRFLAAAQVYGALLAVEIFALLILFVPQFL